MSHTLTSILCFWSNRCLPTEKTRADACGVDCPRAVCAMRKIDVTNMELVHYGREWEHASPPCSREMMPLLERKESLVFWLQPKGGRTCDQVPAMKLKDGFYTLSLRMMKAIWRHVRLKKGFRNIERTHLGSYKLRIPSPLMGEKLRTQGRFNVSTRISPACASVYFNTTLGIAGNESCARCSIPCFCKGQAREGGRRDCVRQSVCGGQGEGVCARAGCACVRGVHTESLVSFVRHRRMNLIY